MPALRLLLTIACAASLTAQAFHRRGPTFYKRGRDDNVVTRLDARLASGELELPPEGPAGRLRPLLRALGVPEASQLLVFSKTSLQRHHVSLQNPRALYFGPDVYVGWIPGAASIELACGDPALGVVFYSLPQDPATPPRLRRDDSCLRCHATTHTDEEPGVVLRSVFVDPTGHPIASAGDVDVTLRTPLVERWGGWLVTGAFEGRHRGNAAAVADERGGYAVPHRPAADLTAFAELRAGDYPAATSDIAALLVFEQQATIHNLLVRATLQTRYLLDKDRVVNELLDEHGMRASTRRVVDRLAAEIAAALLLDGEPSLAGLGAAPAPAFAAAYAAQWPRDERGVRLGELDLTRRTFVLPLSPMVHAPSFAAMPDALRAGVLERLYVAIERGVPPGDVRMTRQERLTLRDHLRATVADWPAAPARDR